jgi:hypothetical protein
MPEIQVSFYVSAGVRVIRPSPTGKARVFCPSISAQRFKVCLLGYNLLRTRASVCSSRKGLECLLDAMVVIHEGAMLPRLLHLWQVLAKKNLSWALAGADPPINYG